MPVFDGGAAAGGSVVANGEAVADGAGLVNGGAVSIVTGGDDAGVAEGFEPLEHAAAPASSRMKRMWFTVANGACFARLRRSCDTRATMVAAC